MTAHIHPLALPTIAGVWDGPHTNFSLGQESQENGKCAPPPNFPHTSNSQHGPSRNRLQAQITELLLHHHDEIRVAVEFFKALELDGDEVCRDSFPLPTLGPLLDACSREIYYGGGICILRGLHPSRYSHADNMIIYLGISSYIGGQRGVQSSKGAMVTHVVENKEWTVPKERRHGIHTNDYLPFHNDMGAEILALQVRDCAKYGGRTCVASVQDIYDDLMQTNPLVVHTLAKPNWPIRSSSRGFVLYPLLQYHGGHLMFSSDPARIGPREGNRAPPLSLEQEMALAVLQNVATKHQLKLDHHPGDLLYLNNWGLLHAREAYQDGETSSRHLIRLWLRNAELAWPVPDSMNLPWDCAFGMRSRKVLNHSYPIVPMPVYLESKYNSGTAAFIPEEDDEEAGEGAVQEPPAANICEDLPNSSLVH